MNYLMLTYKRFYDHYHRTYLFQIDSYYLREAKEAKGKKYRVKVGYHPFTGAQSDVLSPHNSTQSTRCMRDVSLASSITRAIPTVRLFRAYLVTPISRSHIWHSTAAFQFKRTMRSPFHIRGMKNKLQRRKLQLESVQLPRACSRKRPKRTTRTSLRFMLIVDVVLGTVTGRFGRRAQTTKRMWTASWTGGLIPLKRVTDPD